MGKLKLSFGLICFNADFFLKQVLESIYPFAYKICIAEGPVKYWQDKGYMHSMDGTIPILKHFSDPQQKITVIHSKYAEKTEQCRAWFKYVPDDTDYVFCVDADEVHKPEHIESLIQFLEKEQPTSVGFKSDTFYGGFDRMIGGFERDHSFKRVLKYERGCEYVTHRQPTLGHFNIVSDPLIRDIDKIKIIISGNDITGNQLYEATGITMPHYSYVSPKGVYEKLQYYEDSVISKGNCIPNYFEDVWLRWVKSSANGRKEVEARWKGVQEFRPEKRGEAYTLPAFNYKHPHVIERDMELLKDKFYDQLSELS